MKNILFETSWKAVILNWILKLTVKRWFTKLANETSTKKLTRDIIQLRKFFLKLFSKKNTLKNHVQKLHISPQCSAFFIPYPGANKTVLYLHGGGYMIGSAKSYSGFGMMLSASCKINVLLIDYRLVPENALTCAIDDAVQSYNYLLKKGNDPQSIFITGDSAGGGLAISTTLKLRDTNTPLPKGIICFSPWTDLLLKNTSHQTNKKRDACLVMPKEFILFKGIDLSHPYISPIYADFKGLPDIFIQVSDAEILLDDSTILAKKAESQGVNVTLEIWKNMPHCFPLFAQYIPEGKQALAHVSEFMQRI